MTLPVIIPTYRGEERLPRVLSCLAAQSQVTMPWIRDNNTNGIYYTGAVNEGLRKFAFSDEHEYVLVLCDDVYLGSNCLERLMAVAKEQPRAGIIAPRQVSHEGRTIWCGSLSSWPGGSHIAGGYPEEPHQTHWATGACLLLRTEAVREIGLLDRNLRIICQDSDYSFTARSRGWEVWVAPDATVEHEYRISRNVTDAAVNEIKYQDVLYFTEKWLSGRLFRALEYGGDAIPFDHTKTTVDNLNRALEVRQGEVSGSKV